MFSDFPTARPFITLGVILDEKYVAKPVDVRAEAA